MNLAKDEPSDEESLATMSFKMGHGGTLDPLATGVLIVGIGRGTKHLINFLECTKTYETVVLFGKSTDTYDVMGRVVADAPTNHITKGMVDEKFNQFRGSIKQVPPIYSALKIDGMKAYDYARTGKELPRELERRDMTVNECQLLEWLEDGQHEYRWPAAEAAEEDKAAARRLMKGPGHTEGMAEVAPTESADDVQKNTDNRDSPTSKQELNSMAPFDKAALHTHGIPTLRDRAANAPVAKVRLTVSSGFYVRSFAHDLGIACDSFAIMAELARTRQADYTCLEPAPPELIPCLTYEELERGEDVWGPKIADILDKWMQKNPVPSKNAVDDRDCPNQQGRSKERSGFKYQSPDQRLGKRRWKDGNGQDGRRRNSSSPE